MHVHYSYSAHIHIVSISNNSQDANLRNYYKPVSSTFLALSLLLAEFHTQHDELQLFTKWLLSAAIHISKESSVTCLWRQEKGLAH